MKVLHVITGLDTGGAETLLLRLVSAMPAVASEVVSLTGRGALAERLEQAGVPVRAMAARSATDLPRVVRGLRAIERAVRPDVVQTRLYHADLAGALAFGSRPLFWGVHATALGPDAVKRTTALTARVCAVLSRRPTRVVYDSEEGRRVHERLGYDASRSIVVPNGFDTAAFRPDPAARARVRRELGLTDDAEVVGHVARFHPVKDHASFVRAAARLAAERPRARFVLAGSGVDASNAALRAAIDGTGVPERFVLAGPRGDVPALMATFDVLASSSYTEAFPLVVGEAMACGVPCVVTDVGDCARVVGDTGRVVAARDPEALAHGIVALLDDPRREALGRAARDRIVANYGLAATAEAYARLYRDAVTSRLS